MGFDLIPKLRDAFAQIPGDVLKPQHRSILHLINSYADDRKSLSVCFIGSERMCAELGYKRNYVSKLLHQLGNGQIRDRATGQWRMCTKANCQHLDLVKSHVPRARAGTRQNYSIKFDKVWSLVSVYSDTHSEASSVYSDTQERVPQSDSVSTPVHPYKEYIDNKQTVIDDEAEILIKAVPEAQRSKLDPDRVSAFFRVWLQIGGLPRPSLREAFDAKRTDWTQIASPQRYLEHALSEILRAKLGDEVLQELPFKVGKRKSA